MEPDHAAEVLETMLLSGIRQPADRQVVTAQQALALLHDDLQLLEHHVGAGEPAASALPRAREKTPTTDWRPIERLSRWYHSPVVKMRPPCGRSSGGSSSSRIRNRRW